jgi:hypothetical protein
MSKHSKCTDTYEKIDEAALWDLLHQFESATLD